MLPMTCVAATPRMIAAKAAIGLAAQAKAVPDASKGTAAWSASTVTWVSGAESAGVANFLTMLAKADWET